ncbi:hypothetical protein JB92DRAFT_3022497 [Gautieria morchelliformis]|nr:hypothetical protein JB92DRAFT_3022497 [Gautieria morchelliformis]
MMKLLLLLCTLPASGTSSKYILPHWETECDSGPIWSELRMSTSSLTFTQSGQSCQLKCSCGCKKNHALLYRITALPRAPQVVSVAHGAENRLRLVCVGFQTSFSYGIFPY